MLEDDYPPELDDFFTAKSLSPPWQHQVLAAQAICVEGINLQGPKDVVCTLDHSRPGKT